MAPTTHPPIDSSSSSSLASSSLSKLEFVPPADSPIQPCPSDAWGEMFLSENSSFAIEHFDSIFKSQDSQQILYDYTWLTYID